MGDTSTIQAGNDFGGSYSRFSFFSTGAQGKGQLALLKEKNKPVLDDDFNWIQDAILTYIRKTFHDVIGDGSTNNGFNIDGSGSLNNDFVIKGGDSTVDGAGIMMVGGLRVILPTDMNYSAQAGVPVLAPPGSGTRSDTVYIDAMLDEEGPSSDPTMVDPTLGAETSRRLQLTFQVLVAPGGATPSSPYVDASNRLHFTALLATIVRTTSAQITSGMITDERGIINVPAVAAEYVDAHDSSLTAHYPATTAQRGFVPLATNAMAIAGTDTVAAVTCAALAAALAVVAAGEVPTGTKANFVGASAPSGWLVRDGSAISRTSYATLFGLMGTTYGPGDGFSTFNLPDDRGRVEIGSGTGAGLTARSLGAQSGEEAHLMLLTELVSHNHLNGVADDSGAVFVNGTSTTGMPGSATSNVDETSGGANVQGPTSNTGGGTPFNVMQPFTASLPIIKY